MIGGIVQSCCEMHVRFRASPYLANMYCISLLYILLSLPMALRALIRCSPMHLMYAFVSK